MANDQIFGCMICGKDLIYLKQTLVRVRCAYCQKEELVRTICPEGHYVCDECHRKGILGQVEQVCWTSEVKDPVRLAEIIFQLPGLHMHGPEYHSIVPAVLVAAYGNSKNHKQDKDIKEAIRRGKDVVGGTCGSHGACGAGIGVGIAYSVINGVTPYSVEARGAANRMVSLALLEISNYGGPRCCKRDSMIAIETAARHFGGFEEVSYDSYRCRQFMNNKGCIHEQCPYFPVRGES